MQSSCQESQKERAGLPPVPMSCGLVGSAQCTSILYHLLTSRPACRARL